MVCIALACLFTACSEDSDLTNADVVDSLLETTLLTRQGGNNGRPGGGQGGPGGGGPGQGGPQVSDMDSELLQDWIDLFLEVDRYAYGMRPNATARALAYIHLAAYETAVNGMVNNGTLMGQFSDLNINIGNLPNRLHLGIALNTCYAMVLDHFMINLEDQHRAKIAALEAQKQAEYNQGLPDEVLVGSILWGTHVAEQIIAFAQTDSEAEQQILEPQPTSYEPPVGPGFWTYSAEEERGLFPYWTSVRTFVIAPDETTTIPPIPYNTTPGSDYFNQMMEVYQVNNTAKAEDNEDLWIAEFWSDDVEGLMFSPPARQFSIAKQLIDQYELDLQQALVLCLKLGFSLNDAAVATWKYKYEHMVMRPNVYIHEFIDPDFQTNLYRLIYWPNPTFPGYPSGHACFASAAAGVFIDSFGDDIAFTDRSHEGRNEFRGKPRSFSSFTDMAEENAISRIPLGVHIRMDAEEGLRLGYEISNAINDLDVFGNP